MTGKQENNLTRHIAVEKFLDDNNPVWNAHVEFTNGKGAYSTKIAAINAIVGPQGKNLTGIALDKEQLKVLLADLTLVVADAIVVYAVNTSNNTLEQSMSFVPSKLKKKRDTALTDICQLVHDTADANLLILNPYGITAAMLLSLQSLITDYAAAVPTTRNAITNKSVLTLNLKTLFKETDKILKKVILKLARQFKTSDPDFYSGLIKNKEIIDLGKTTTIFRFTVRDTDGNPIEGVKVSIGALFSLADENGKGNIRKVPFGLHDVVFEKVVFQTVTLVNLKFIKGKSVTKKITLLPV